jgi:hypothetical protein
MSPTEREVHPGDRILSLSQAFVLHYDTPHCSVSVCLYVNDVFSPVCNCESELLCVFKDSEMRMKYRHFNKFALTNGPG